MHTPRTEQIAKPKHSGTYWLSVVTLVSLFVVNTLGFTDTITGSALGCGRSFPFCNGQVIPSQWGMPTTIEFTHRVSVLVGAVLLMVLVGMTWWKYRQIRNIRLLAGLSLLGVLAECVLGAVSVLTVNPPSVMAAHFGIALLSFVGVFLLMVSMYEVETQPKEASRRVHWGIHPADKKFSYAVLWSLPYAYVATYVGAFILYKGYGGLFAGWPFPTESFALVGPALLIDLLHRTLALGFLCWMVWLVVLSRRNREQRSDLYRGSVAALLLVTAQALSGALLIYTHISTYAFLLHVTIVTFLFTSQCFLAYRSMQRKVAVAFQHDMTA